MNGFLAFCYDELAEIADRPMTLAMPVDEFPSFTLSRSRVHVRAFCDSCGGSCLRLDGLSAADWVLSHRCPMPASMMGHPYRDVPCNDPGRCGHPRHG